MKLIDAGKLIRSLSSVCVTDDSIGMGIKMGLNHAIQTINDIPSVDAVEVVHGYWKPCGSCGYRCSKCDSWVAFRSLNNYCPNCGAKMDGGSDNGS